MYTTSLAGGNSPGYLDGSGGQAWFGDITGVGSDGTNLWIADEGNERLRDAVPSSWSLVQPPATGVSMATGDVSTVAGSGASTQMNGTGTEASLGLSADMAEVNGSLYFVSAGAGNAIRQANLSTGAITTFAGSTTQTGCVASTNPAGARFAQPSDIVSDGTYLYVTDATCGIWKISLATGATSLLLNTFPGVGDYIVPHYLTIGPGGFIFLDGGNLGGISEINPATGAIVADYSVSGVPGGLAADSNTLWVAEQFGGYNSWWQLGSIALSTGQQSLYALPQGYQSEMSGGQILSTAGYLYTADENGDRLEQISKTGSIGAIDIVAGQSAEGYADGYGTRAQFVRLAGVATDGSNIYVADSINYRIREVSAGPGGAPMTNGNLLGSFNPSYGCGCQQQPRAAGDPVDAGTGNYTETSTDLAVPGRGMALGFARTYNSDPSASGTNGLLGYGWSLSYGMSLGECTPSQAQPCLGDPGNFTSPVWTVNQENGSQVQFSQSGSTFAPTQPETTATLTSSGNNFVFARHDQGSYTFNGSGVLTGESDLNGNVTTLTYPSNEIVVSDPAGRTLTMTTGGGHITSVSDSASPPRTVQFGYDSAGDLTNVTGVNGGVTVYGYNAAHQLVEVQTPRFYTGSPLPGAPTGCSGAAPADVMAMVYSSSGQVICQWDADSRQTTFNYTAVPGSTLITDPKGNQTLDTFDNGQLTSQTKGYGTSQAATWTFAYDPVSGGTTEVVDPNGHMTQYFRDDNGTCTAGTGNVTANLCSEVDPLGRVTTWSYNSYNEVTGETRAATYGTAGTVTTAYTYDEAAYSAGGHGNLTTVSTPILAPSGTSQGVQVTHLVHGSSTHPGDVTSMIDPDGNTWAYTYDAFGDRITQTAPATSDNSDSSGSHQNVIKWAYNTGTGWLTATLSGRYVLAHPTATTCVAPATGCSTDSYDNTGRVLVATDSNGHATTTHYDPDGNPDYSVDADGNKTLYAYDPAGQLTVTTCPDGTTVKANFWPDGTVEDQIDASGADTHYTYDPLGHGTSVTDTDGRTTTYVYDPVGNLVAKGDPGVAGCAPTSTLKGCTVSSYDAADELTGVAYHDPATPDVSALGYDGDGRRTTMTDGTGTSAWSYDSLGRLVATTDGSGATIGYGYDPNGNQTSTLYPAPTGTVTRSFDAENREASLTDWRSNTTSFTYDADGELTSGGDPTTGGTPVVDSSTYDPAGQLSATATTQGATGLASQGYTRDSNNQVTSETDTGLAGSNQSYAYDPLNQVQTANTSAYAYDPAGSPVTLGGATSQSFDPAGQLVRGTTAAGPQVAAGSYDTYMVSSDGTVWGAGLNSVSQLGSFTGSVADLPIPIPSVTGATAVTAGYASALALTSTGGLEAWGDGADGELGNGTTTASQAIPVVPTGMGSGITAVSMGAYGEHVLAVKGGMAYAWGNDTAGQVGNNTTEAAVSTPYAETAITATVVAVAAGQNHSLALTSTGQVWAWGDNTSGELGDGTTTSRAAPELLTTISGVTAIAAGTGWSMALKADGTVWTWGDNTYGELGHTTSTPLVPTQVALAVKSTQISAGHAHALVLGIDGSVTAWGLNNLGQVGNGTTGTQAAPVTVIASGATGIAAGLAQSVATLSGSTVDTWGYNADGQLADYSFSDVHTPTDVPWLAATSTAPAGVAAGGYDTYGVFADGSVWGAGMNSVGQLGSSVYTSSIPTVVAGVSGAKAVTSGIETALALTAAGGLEAWGYGTNGELGNGTTPGAQPAPVVPTGMGSGVTSVSMGAYGDHVLAVKAGTAYAWGANGSGQVGNNTTASAVSSPYALSSITGTVVAVAAGSDHSLALTSSGQVWAWGDNSSGELGDGTTTSQSAPELLTTISGVSAISAGDGWSMALKSDGTVWTWGDNTYGELGHPTSVPDMPSQVTGLTATVTQISAGPLHALVLGAGGAVSAWGDNSRGEIGTCYPTDQATPTTAIASGATSVAAGLDDSVATLANGTVDTWGYNYFGQLADGSNTDMHTPSPDLWLAGINQTVTQYGYDTRGNLTSIAAPNGNTTALVYNQADQLSSFGATTSYAYNGNGLRTTKTVNGATQHFTYDTTTSTPTILTDTTNAYLYGPDGLPLEQLNLTTSTVAWYHHDQLGTTRLLTNDSGNVVGTATYNPYGQPTATTGTTTPLGYAGAYTDPESGLIYLINRYYDPQTAQFLSVDPLAGLTQSPYGYVHDNPLNGTDASGLWNSGDCPGAGFGGGGGEVGGYGGCGLLLANTVNWGPQEGYTECIANLQACKGSNSDVAFGIILGIVSVGTGGAGFLVEEAFLATDLAVASAVSGGGAAALDTGPCLQGDHAACVGALLGWSATAAGTATAAGFAAGLSERSLSGALLKGLAPGGALTIGAGGVTIDLTMALARLFGAGLDGNAPTCGG